MRCFTLTIITLLTITLQAMAADLSFSYEKFTLKGNTLQYRKAVIEGAEAKPLLLPGKLFHNTSSLAGQHRVFMSSCQKNTMYFLSVRGCGATARTP